MPWKIYKEPDIKKIKEDIVILDDIKTHIKHKLENDGLSHIENIVMSMTTLENIEQGITLMETINNNTYFADFAKKMDDEDKQYFAKRNNATKILIGYHNWAGQELQKIKHPTYGGSSKPKKYRLNY